MSFVMGATYVTVTVSNLDRSAAPYEASFLVDTGAIDCLAPASALRNAGIKIEGRNAYEMASGQSVEFPYGFARVSFMGSETVCPVVFGPDEAEPLLGLIALEGVGIGVDPVTRTLRRWAAKPLKALQAL